MNQPVDKVKTRLGDLATNLLNALETRDRAKTLAAQQELTGNVTALWNAREEVDVDPKTKAILRPVAGWAMNELPMQIQDSMKHAEIRRELKLFQRSLVMFS